MNAAASTASRNGKHRVSRLVSILGLAVTASLCLGQQTPESSAPQRRRTMPQRIVQLPPPNTSGTVALEQAFVRQGLPTVMSAQPLGPVEAGQLAWAAMGAVPVTNSAGEVVLYIVASDGVYRYTPNRHYLEQLSSQDLRAVVGTSVRPQNGLSGCGFLMTSTSRTRPGRSDSPARRWLLLETGQRIQNLRLQGVGLGLAVAVAQEFDGALLSRALNLPRNTEVVGIVFAGYRPGETSTGLQTTLPVPGPVQTAKRAVLIVPASNCPDQELFETNRVLSAAGIETVVASSRTGSLAGVSGGVAQARFALSQITADLFDAIVFIGGPGAAEYAASTVAQGLAREAIRQGKVVAAISTTPTILANAGLLNGVRVTASETEREALVKAGAIFTDNAVELDRSFITANNPISSALFAQTIAETLQRK